jgi:hypothetical protein
MRVLVLTNMYPSPSAPFYGAFVGDEVRTLRRTIALMQKRVPVVWTFHEGSIATGATNTIERRPGKRLAHSRTLKTRVAQRVDAVIAVLGGAPRLHVERGTPGEPGRAEVRSGGTRPAIGA